MSVELHDEAPPQAIAFVLAHLLPLAVSTDRLGSKRWKAGMPTPYRMVSGFGGPNDGFTQWSTIRVHDFGATETEAQREAIRTERRMQILIRKPYTDVVMADGRIANCEWCEHVDGPREEPYSAESVVVRLITEYNFAHSFVAV